MNESTNNDTLSQLQPFLSRSLFTTCKFYLFTVSTPICLFGVLSNITNMIVFVKMGFSTSSNISLFCLAIADFLISGYTLFSAFVLHPALPKVRLTISTNDILRAAAHVYYSVMAIGSWITAIINLERSCCVAFPLKVRQIFTRRTIVCLIGGMVFYQIASGIPRSFGVRFMMTTSPQTNVSKLTYVIFRPRLVIYSFLFSFSIPNILCFVAVIIGTIFLTSTLKQSDKFHEAMRGTAEGQGRLSTKNVRLARCMILISVIYILGAFPGVAVYIAQTAYPALHIDNPYYNTLTALMYYSSFVFQAFSSAVNIFVYFRMGSKFNKTFREVFSLNLARARQSQRL